MYKGYKTVSNVTKEQNQSKDHNIQSNIVSLRTFSCLQNIKSVIYVPIYMHLMLKKWNSNSSQKS